MEIQINGGTVAQKMNFAYCFFETRILIDAVFQKDEMIDIIGVTKGEGYEGVVTRWFPVRHTGVFAKLPVLVLVTLPRCPILLLVLVRMVTTTKRK